MSGEPAPLSQDVAATFCATLVDEWERAGITSVIVSPGSRSTPLALAVIDSRVLQVLVHHDERSAAFMALGCAIGSGEPAVVITTSGTAAVELHPAMVEAHHAQVPLIAVTADRPPELQGVGAPQTINQRHLYGDVVRWFGEPGVPEWESRRDWRPLARRAVDEARGRGQAHERGPGPVHLNIAFREPLVGKKLTLPRGKPVRGDITAGVPVAISGIERPDSWVGRLAGRRGVIVVGRNGGEPDDVHGLAERLGWPVLADPLSGCYRARPNTVAHWDGILRVPEFVDQHRPEVVLRLGALPGSKVLGQWLAGLDALQFSLPPIGQVFDPDGTVDESWAGGAEAGVVWLLAGLAAAASEETDAAWGVAWQQASERAAEAVEAVLSDIGTITEPGVARLMAREVLDVAGGDLMVSSSMPIRDVEWFAAPAEAGRVQANRGANGIDGVVSTAVGLAAYQQTRHDDDQRVTGLLIGDVALLHDTNGLLKLDGRKLDLTIVVVNNNGGGIFSFLPQRGSVPVGYFEYLFGTPHDVNIGDLARVHGLYVLEPATMEELEDTLHQSMEMREAQFIVVNTDRTANVDVHNRLNAAIAARVAGGWTRH